MSDPLAPPRATTRLPTLDGLRGLAIVAVLAHQLERLDTPDGLLTRTIATVLDRGWLGVQLFFVLSGFLITALLMDAERAPAAFGRFYLRRARRILPLYLLLLVGVLVLVPAWAGAPDCAVAPSPSWPYWLMVSNWTDPLRDLHDPCVVHLWSLGVEEQFYLLWPLLVLGRRPARVLAVCAIAAVVAIVARGVLPLLDVPPAALYTWSVTRMDALAAGAAVAAVLRMPAPRAWLAGRESRLAVGALVALAAGWIVTRGYPRLEPVGQLLGYPLTAACFAVLLAACASADLRDGARRLRSLLTRRWLCVIGRHSYAMYLLHKPFDHLVGRPVLAGLGLAARDSLAISVGYTIAGTVALLGLSWLSWRWIEGPFLRDAPARA